MPFLSVRHRRLDGSAWCDRHVGLVRAGAGPTCGRELCARRESRSDVLRYWPLVLLAAPVVLAIIMDVNEYRRARCCSRRCLGCGAALSASHAVGGETGYWPDGFGFAGGKLLERRIYAAAKCLAVRPVSSSSLASPILPIPRLPATSAPEPPLRQSRTSTHYSPTSWSTTSRFLSSAAALPKCKFPFPDASTTPGSLPANPARPADDRKCCPATRRRAMQWHVKMNPPLHSAPALRTPHSSSSRSLASASSRSR